MMHTVPQFENIRHDGVSKMVGFFCVLTSPFWVYGLFFPFEADFGIDNIPLTVIPIFALVIVVQLALIWRLSAGDRFIAGVMVVGLVLKFVAVSAFMFMISRVYDGSADNVYYYGSAWRIVDKFSMTGEWTFLRPFWETNFIISLTSWLMFVFGPSFQALMIIFAALSFWGQYLFFRAFCIAFPTGQHRTAAFVMFFLPSIVFWPASIGKDALIFFFIAACCYGFAKLSQQNSLVGLVTVLVSLAGVMLVRPHIAGMLAISLFSAYVLSRNAHDLLGVAAKCFGIPLLLIASVYFFVQANAFLDVKTIQGTTGVISNVAKNNYIGGSAFGNSLTARLAGAPFLLFRPFLWEARSAQAALAAMEGFVVLIFFWRRRRIIRSSFLSCRAKTFVLFLWLYTLEFTLAFAGAMSNFGLLVRQRVMLLPIALMIVLSHPLPVVDRSGIRRI
jgi:hypothetical protein